MKTSEEVRQWNGKCNSPDRFGWSAKHIIDWINNHGGQAYYIPVGPIAQLTSQKPLIAILTINDWDYAAPSDTIEMGSWFNYWQGYSDLDLHVLKVREFKIQRSVNA